jgi:acetyl esterase/lipase
MSYVLVDELAAIAPHIPTFDLTDVEGTRETARRIVSADPRYEPEQPLTVEDVVIPGHRGGPDVAARVYRPAARAGLVPGLIYLHTGGFMMGSIDDIDSPARMIADRTGVAVLTVDYRLAPVTRHSPLTWAP